MALFIRISILVFCGLILSPMTQAAPPQYKVIKNGISLWAGTVVILELVQTLDNKTLSEGNIVRFKVVEDVVVNNKILIHAGVAAYGKVRRIELCGNDNCTEIFIVAENVQAVDGQTVNLSGIEQSFRASLSQKKKKTYTQPLLNATVLNTKKIEA